MAALTRKQQIFRDEFARLTGLNRRFVGAWLLAEQSSSAAQNYDRRNYNNWLNIGNTDSLVASGGSFKSSVWADPRRAAKASADWMRGRGPVAKSYGRPAAGITRILSTAGKGPEAQIRALASSGWASSGYNGGNTLRQLMGVAQGGAADSSSGRRSPGPGSTSGASSPARTTTTTTTTDEFDQAGFDEAMRRARTGATLRRLGGGRRWQMLSSLLPDEESVTREQFARPVTTTTTRTTRTRSRSGPRSGSTKSKGGGKIPGLKGKGSGIFELFNDRIGGWKHGQNIGAIGDHDGHVHAAAGPKTIVGLAKIAEEMGLRVGEHPKYGGVAPVHVQGSYHTRPGGQAIDVTGDAKARDRFTRRVMSLYNLK